MLGMGRSPAMEASRRGKVLYVNGASVDVQKCAGTITMAGLSSGKIILIDSAAHFLTGAHPVAVGDKVTTSAGSTTVYAVGSDTQLTLVDDILVEAATGSNTTATANKLIDARATFQTAGVTTGYIVRNNDDSTWGTVVTRDSQTQLTLSADIFPEAGGTDIGYRVFALSAYTVYYKRTGATWGLAYLTEKDAEVVATSGKEIWMAGATGAGQTYLPTALTTQTIYHIAIAGVNVYGGFKGDEILRSQRNPDLYLTILSGNVGGTEGTNGSYHVLSTNEAALTSPSVWDGFTIRGGVCDGATTDIRQGAGVSSLGGLVLTNCKITACKGYSFYVDATPSALYAKGGNYFDVTVTSCTLGSGAVYIKDAVQFGNIIVSGCTGVNNAGSRSVKFNLGPITGRNLVISGCTPSPTGNNGYALGFPGATFGTITNVVVTDNVGGGIQAAGTTAGLVNIDHATVTRNALTGTGGGIRQSAAGATSTVLNVTNSIVYGNTATADNNMSAANAANLTADHSDCQGGFSGIGNIDTDPLFVAATDAIGPDLKWNTADDGLIPTAAACLASGSDGDNMGNYRRSL